MVFQEKNLASYLRDFSLKGNKNVGSNNALSTTFVETSEIGNLVIKKFINEYWTSRQRQSSSIHEVSYRACFKAQLPRFFINLLTAPGDLVYDPFSGRGTTAVEAGMLGRRVVANDINPLSKILARPRLSVPALQEIYARLDRIEVNRLLKADIDLSMFYAPETEAEIVSLKKYLEQKQSSGLEDDIDSWIRMVATNRLTGHSTGFFSVYTLPPNQAVSAERQIKINRQREQKPSYRDTRKLIKKKTAALLKKLSTEELARLRNAAETALFLDNDARLTPEIAAGEVSLTVTSPPFLDVVQYSKDNWLRCWFNAIEAEEIEGRITMVKSIDDWAAVMGKVFVELYRVTKIGGWVAFEVGEVRGGTINLEDHVIPLGMEAGFNCFGVIINRQKFTKTSNIWGINNNSFGTNTNRIVLFYKI